MSSENHSEDSKENANNFNDFKNNYDLNYLQEKLIKKYKKLEE